MKKNMIIDIAYIHNNQNVTYAIYSEKGKKIDIKQISSILDKTNKNSYKLNHAACFSGLVDAIKYVKNPNRLVYFLNKSEITSNLNMTEISNYIKLCKKYQILPKYINKYMIENYCPIIKYEEPNKSLLYIYLCALRMLQEYPAFPKVLVLLVNKYKLDFHVAWEVASMYYVSNTGHNFVSYYSTYYNKLNLSDLFISIRWICGFKKYMIDPDKYDKNRFVNISTNSHSAAFNASYLINGLYDTNLKIKVSDILNKDISKIIECKNDTELKEYFKNLNITYTN